VTNHVHGVAASEKTPDILWRDLRSVLDEEVNRLPIKYRAPFVLCYLEGKTNEEAAHDLGCPKGTVLSRLAWARARLRGRLTRRGVALSSGLCASQFAQNVASATLSSPLVKSTLVAVGQLANGTLPTTAIVLAENVVRSLFLAKLKSVMILGSALVITTAGAGWVIHAALKAQQPVSSAELRQQPNENKALTDRDGNPLPAGAVARLGRLRLRHGGDIEAIAYSPNNRLLASAGSRKLKLWEAATGRLLRQWPAFGLDGARSIAFSPDSRLLAAGGSERMICVWDVATGKQVHLLRGHGFGHLGSMPATHVAFTPDGASLISGGYEAVLQVWDVASGKELLSLRPEGGPRKPGETEAAVAALSVSPDGNTVATALGTEIWLRDLTGERPPQKISADTFVHDVKYSPDGKTLAWSDLSSSKDQPRHAIHIWDINARKERLQLPAHQHRTNGCAFSPDGRQLASCGSDGTIVWDTETGKEIRRHTERTGWTRAPVFSPDGAILACAVGDGSVRLWDAATGQERLAPESEGRLAEVLGLSVTSDGQTVLTGSKDGGIRVWDLATGRLRQNLSIKTDYLGMISFTADGTKAAVGDRAKVELWDITSGTRLWSKEDFLPREPEIEFTYAQTDTLVFSRDGRRLVSATVDLADSERKNTVLRVWDTATGELVAQVNRLARLAGAPAVSLDGKTFTLSEYTVEDGKRITDWAIRIFETDTGRLVRESKMPHGASVSCHTPDGKALVTAGGKYVSFWDAGGALQFSLAGPTAGTNFSLLAFSPDGKRVAAASNWQVGIIHIWEIASGELVNEFDVAVKSLQFTPNGNSLVTGIEDGSVLIWDLNSPAAARPQRTQLSRDELEKRWLRLGYGFDSRRGNHGIDERTNDMAEGGDLTVAFLQEQLLDPELPKKDQELARRLAAPLADPDPAVRAQAIQELAAWGNDAWLAVKEAAEAPASPEMLGRIERVLLHNLEYRRSSHGAIDVLKLIGSPRARRLLAKLAEGPEENQEQKNRKLMAKYALNNLEKLRVRSPDSK
jgi:WD40 repeat protein